MDGRIISSKLTFKPSEIIMLQIMESATNKDASVPQQTGQVEGVADETVGSSAVLPQVGRPIL